MQEPSINELRDAKALGEFSAPKRRTLTALFKSSVGAKLIEEVEKELVDERKGLVADLAAARKRRDTDAPKLQAALLKAKAEFEEAERQLPLLRQAYHLAMAVSEGPEVTFQRDARALIEALHASADPRLKAFRWHLEQLQSCDLVLALQMAPNPARERDRWAPSMVSNLVEVTVARDAINAAIERVEAARLEALTTMETSELLNVVCAQLAPPLAAVFLNPPSLTADEMEPGLPMKFSGGSVWIVNERLELTREERKARSEERKARAT